MSNTDHVHKQGLRLDAEQMVFLERLRSTLLAMQTNVLEKLQTIHKLVLERFQAKQGTIILLDAQGGHYLILAATNPSLVGQVKKIEPKGITEHILQNKSLFVSEEDIFFAGGKQRQWSRALLALPVLSKDGEALGIFYLTGLPENRVIDKQEKGLLLIISKLLAPYFEMAFWGKQLVISREAQRGDILTELMNFKGDLPEDVDLRDTLDLSFEEEDMQVSPEGCPWLPPKTATKSDKKKATYYLRPEIHKLLTEACEQSRVLLRQKAKVSKSEIVNWALEVILSDFSKNKGQSLLVQRLKEKEGR